MKSIGGPSPKRRLEQILGMVIVVITLICGVILIGASVWSVVKFIAYFIVITCLVGIGIALINGKG